MSQIEKIKEIVKSSKAAQIVSTYIREGKEAAKEKAHEVNK